jgi:hypothetical protein
VTPHAYLKRGCNPSDAQLVELFKDAEKAEAEIKEAADSETGLFDLPLQSGASAISKGGPLSYSETSPYVWSTLQRDTGRGEDGR